MFLPNHVTNSNCFLIPQIFLSIKMFLWDRSHIHIPGEYAENLWFPLAEIMLISLNLDAFSVYSISSSTLSLNGWARMESKHPTLLLKAFISGMNTLLTSSASNSKCYLWTWSFPNQPFIKYLVHFHGSYSSIN